MWKKLNAAFAPESKDVAPWQVIFHSIACTRWLWSIWFFCILWLNTFPVKNEVSQEFSPQSTVVRTKLSCKKHFRIQFGYYDEFHDEPDPWNTISPRTHPAIAVGPTGNLNSTIKFFCLITGSILKRRNFTRFPMPDRIIRKKKHGVRNGTGSIWQCYRFQGLS